VESAATPKYIHGKEGHPKQARDSNVVAKEGHSKQAQGVAHRTRREVPGSPPGYKRSTSKSLMDLRVVSSSRESYYQGYKTGTLGNKEYYRQLIVVYILYFLN
jgi:hypothetical protein